MLLHSESAIAYHRFDGTLTETLRGFAWSVIQGREAYTAGKIGMALVVRPQIDVSVSGAGTMDLSFRILDEDFRSISAEAVSPATFDLNEPGNYHLQVRDANLAGGDIDVTVINSNTGAALVDGMFTITMLFNTATIFIPFTLDIVDTIVGHSPASDYGTFHGSERLTFAFWGQNLFDAGSDLRIGFHNDDEKLANGMRMVSKEDSGEVVVSISLVNDATEYEFSVNPANPDASRAPGLDMVHFVVIQLDRAEDRWVMRFSIDGGGFRDGGEVDAPRFIGGDIDLPDDIPDNESFFGLSFIGPAVSVDELVVWSDARPLPCHRLEKLFSLGFQFREPMDAYSDRFNEQLHPPTPKRRRPRGALCAVNRPPEIESGDFRMDVAENSFAHANEIELFAQDPDGGRIQWSVSGAAIGEPTVRRHPFRKDGVVIRYRPFEGETGMDGFTVRSESRCGLFDEATIEVDIVPVVNTTDPP